MISLRLLEDFRLREWFWAEMGAAGVATLSLICSSNLTLATPAAHQSACQATQLCAVKPASYANYGSQLTSRSLMRSSSSLLSTSSGLRVERCLGQLGSVRHGEEFFVSFRSEIIF